MTTLHIKSLWKKCIFTSLEMNKACLSKCKLVLCVCSSCSYDLEFQQKMRPSYMRTKRYYGIQVRLKEHSHGWMVWKVQPKFFDFVVCNPCQSSPSLTILVPLWFIIISLVFFYLCKALFSGFLQFKGNFVDDQNNSKHCGCAPLRNLTLALLFNHSKHTRSKIIWLYQLGW